MNGDRDVDNALASMNEACVRGRTGSIIISQRVATCRCGFALTGEYHAGVGLRCVAVARRGTFQSDGNRAPSSLQQRNKEASHGAEFVQRGH